jgi:uncharacterized protein
MGTFTKISTILFLILTIFGNQTSKAQSNILSDQSINTGIRAYYSIENNEIRLRWVPQNYRTWKLANERGFILKKMISEKNGTKIPINEMLKSASEYHFHIADPSKFEGSDNDNVHIAGNAVYNPEEFQLETFSKNPLIVSKNFEDQKKNRYLFSLLATDLNVEAAELMAMFFRDPEIETEMEYIYSIQVDKLEPEEERASKVGYITVRTYKDEFKPLPEIPDLITESGDSTATLTWKTDADRTYNSFDIYRRREDKEFEKITKDRFLANVEDGTQNIIYMDRLPENRVRYSYFIVGHTSFGLEGPKSSIVHAEGKPKPLGFTPSIQDITPLDNGINISWSFPEELIGKIKRYEVLRAKKKDGQYERIQDFVDPGKKDFTDEKPNLTNYYAIVAIDENDYELVSSPVLGQLEDNEPPAAPQGGTATIDKNGDVIVKWQPNTEDDLSGYQVFAGNNRDGEYVAITSSKIKETTFYHYFNIDILADKTYFKLAAYDFRENRSVFSEPIEAIIPDIIPPAMPTIINVKSVASGIQIDFFKSPSKDVVKHEIERKVATSDEWKIIQTIDASNPIPSNFYLDNKGELMEEYDYRLKAYDEAGLSSGSKIFRAKNFAGGFHPDIVNPFAFEDKALKYTYLNNSSQLANTNSTGIDGYIKLYWEYPATKNIYDFQIYRSFKNNPAILLKSVNYEDAIFKGSIALPNNNGGNNNTILGNPNLINPNNTTNPNTNTNTNPNPTTIKNTTNSNPSNTNGKNRFFDDKLYFLSLNNGYYEYADKTTGSTVIFPSKAKLTQTVISYENTFGTYDNYVDGATTIQIPTINTPNLNISVKGAITVYYDTQTDITLNITGQKITTQSSSTTIKGGILASPNALISANLVFSQSVKGFNEYFDKVTGVTVGIPNTFNLNQQTLTFQAVSLKSSYDEYADPKGNTVIIPTSTTPTLLKKGQVASSDHFVDTSTGIYMDVPIGQNTNNGVGNTPKGALVGKLLSFSQMQNTHYEYIDKSSGAIVGISRKTYPKLTQTTLVYENTTNTYDNYPDAGNSIVSVAIPTGATTSLKLISSVKGFDRYEDSTTDTYIMIPNTVSTNNTNSNNNSTQIPNTSNLQAFLVDDDDLNTILSLKSPSILSYQVIVRFKDGTSSRLSAPFKIQ